MEKIEHISVLELPLICRPYEIDNLNKRIVCAKKIYNSMLRGKLKRYNEITKTKEWRNNTKEIVEELKRLEAEPKEKKKSPKLKELYDYRNNVLRENGFSEFSFKSDVANYNCYKENISSNVAILSIAGPMWTAFEKLLYGNGDSVHYKKWNSEFSLTSNGKSGIRFIEKEGRYYVVLSNIRHTKKKLEIKVKDNHLTPYEKEMLQSGTPRIVRIVKRVINGKDAFYVQLTLPCKPAIKYKKDGTLQNPMGKGKVGIAIWRNEICAVSNDKVIIRTLFPDADEYTEKTKELGRKLEHIRRVNNPENYNEDGTIKKGIMKDGKRQRLVWYTSNHYKEVKQELREIHRYYTEKKTLYQNKLINELLSMGNEFYLAESSFITKKEEFDEENRLPNYEYRKKKDRRKSIQKYSPASLLTKLEQKLKQAGEKPIEKIDIPENLYWYNHITGVSEKEPFNNTSISPDKTIHISQTAYRAFLITRFEKDIFAYNQKLCYNDYEHFKEMYLSVELPTEV